MVKEKESSRKTTKTSSFGVSKRESHDSSQFYDSNLFKGLPKLQDVEHVDNSKNIPSNVLDHVVLGNSRKMDKVPDNSTHFNFFLSLLLIYTKERALITQLIKNGSSF